MRKEMILVLVICIALAGIYLGMGKISPKANAGDQPSDPLDEGNPNHSDEGMSRGIGADSQLCCRPPSSPTGFTCTYTPGDKYCQPECVAVKILDNNGKACYSCDGDTCIDSTSTDGCGGNCVSDTDCCSDKPYCLHSYTGSYCSASPCIPAGDSCNQDYADECCPGGCGGGPHNKDVCM
jgi:hypothetical protein